MPQVCSRTAVKRSHRIQPISAPKKARSQPSQQPKPTPCGDWSGPPLSILGQPSPSIASTTHNEMLFWVGWFARFHADGAPYVPYEIKTLDCPVVHADGSPVLGQDGHPQMMRCLREVARHEVSGSIEWLMISWHIGVPGMAFQKYSTLDNAIDACHGPTQPVHLR